MKSNSIIELKKSLLELSSIELTSICLRLLKHKKENKELLSYILYESNDEQNYIENIKTEIDEMFQELIPNSTYRYIKQVRKILKFANKQVKYSSIPQTTIDILIYFCFKLKSCTFKSNLALEKLYIQVIKKTTFLITKLHEDLQFDYKREIEKLN